MDEPLRLIIKKGDQDITQVPLAPPKGCLRIGRDDANELVLPDASVSPRHAEISWSGERIRIKNLCGINGVLHNGRRLRSAARLLPGDTLGIGAYSIALSNPGASAASPKPAAAAPNPRQKRLRLLLFAAILLIALMACALVARHVQQQRALAASPPPPPAASPEPEPTTIVKDFSGLLDQAERALVANDPVTAARLFRQVLNQDPGNSRAAPLFSAIAITARNKLFDDLQADLLSESLSTARQLAAQLAFIAPDEPRLEQVNAWIAAEAQFAQARLLVQNNSFHAAAKILDAIQVFHDERRRKLQQEIAPILRDLDTLAQAEADLDAGRFEQSRQALHSIRQSPWLPPDDLKHANYDLDLLDLMEQMDTALAQSNNYDAIRLGQKITAQTDFPHNNALARVATQLDDLRRSLAKQQKILQKNVGKQLKRLADASSKAEEMTLRFDLLKTLSILHFADADAVPPQELLDQTARLNDYLRDEYQQGYVLENIGQYNDAARHYRAVVAVGWDDGHYYPASKQKLEKIKSAP